MWNGAAGVSSRSGRGCVAVIRPGGRRFRARRPRIIASPMTPAPTNAMGLADRDPTIRVVCFICTHPLHAWSRLPGSRAALASLACGPAAVRPFHDVGHEGSPGQLAEGSGRLPDRLAPWGNRDQPLAETGELQGIVSDVEPLLYAFARPPPHSYRPVRVRQEVLDRGSQQVGTPHGHKHPI